MFNINAFDVQSIITLIKNHPQYAGIITYFICFLEAMAVIGAFIPGVILMPCIGFLIGLSFISYSSTILFAILGTLSADFLSYFIGVYFQDRIHLIWPFTRWPYLLIRSENFFHKHGGKSVFLGRFVGPIRAMIAMVAGMLKMSLLRFSMAIIPSAIIWSAIYIIPGIFIGSLSSEFSRTIIIKIVIVMVSIIIFLWISIWIIKYFVQKWNKIINNHMKLIWVFLCKNNKIPLLLKILSDKTDQTQYLQLKRFLCMCITSILLLSLIYQVSCNGYFISYNQFPYNILHSLRPNKFDDLFFIITLIGDTTVIIIVATFFSYWLYKNKQSYIAWHCIATIGITGAVLVCLKYFIYLDRPGIVSYGLGTSAFPSAHVALSFAFYGFLAMIISKALHSDKRKNLPYIIFTILWFLIAFSRLYLGVHWIEDILGGLLVGISCFLLVSISYNRQYIPCNMKLKNLTYIILGILFFVWVSYIIIQFNNQIENYRVNKNIPSMIYLRKIINNF